MKKDLKKATPDDVTILMTNAMEMSVNEVIEAYCARWQIELFFKELKSTLGVGQYQLERFEAVEAWMNCAIATVLFLEQLRARRMQDRRQSEELKYLSERLKTHGGIKKVKRLLTNAFPPELRVTT